MPAPGVDAAHIIRVLRDHRVDFVVVGGFAVELWDVAVEPTVDVDITPHRSEKNLQRLADALNALGAQIRYEEERVAVPGGFTAAHIKDMMVLNLATVAGPLDITVIPAGTGGYDELITNASDLEYDGVLVPTASLQDVARSKEAAGRPKDLRTLPAIMAHLERRDRE